MYQIQMKVKLEVMNKKKKKQINSQAAVKPSNFESKPEV